MTTIPSETGRCFLDTDSLTQWDNSLIQRFPQAERVPIEGFETGPAGSWDARTTTSWGTCIVEDGLFRYWFSCIPDAENYDENADHWLTCYAESEDGIHWRKPDLKLTGQNRWPGNNLLPVPGCFMGVVRTLPGTIDAKYLAAVVQIEPLEPDVSDNPEFGYEFNGTGTYLFTSDDGFRWRQLTRKPVITHGDTACLLADPLSGRYLLYQKTGIIHGLRMRRAIIGLESKDGVNWEGYDGYRQWRECFVADDYDDLIAAQKGFLISDYYYAAVHRTGNLYVSVESLLMMGTPLVSYFGQSPCGLGQFRLGYSHDGMNWRHPKGRPAWLDLGKPGEFDAGFMIPASTFATHNDELLLYYTGLRYEHGFCIDANFKFRKDIPLSDQTGTEKIGLVKIKKDRFASLAALYKGGFDLDVTYRTGDDLLVNVICPPRGSVRVAIAEPTAPEHAALRQSDSLPGFSFDDCVPLTGDHVHAPVNFRNARIADITRDKPIVLRFELTSSEIFGYEWGAS